MIGTYIRQFGMSNSDTSSVESALTQANEYATRNSAEIISVAILAGALVNNWKLIVAYKEGE